GNPRCFIHPHNAYLEWFAEEGIVGLLGFTCFVGIVFVSLARRLVANRDSLILWGLAATVGVRLMPLFVTTSFFNNWAAVPFWLALGWAMSFNDRAKRQIFSRLFEALGRFGRIR
ncbi:MAG: hypothetical protein PHE27_08845, partial [Alphaproteobacteria bacterium]|nr:hypothetical protein [Alphaproteobacteria bacterium]